jgi:hypothetical protein
MPPVSTQPADRDDLSSGGPLEDLVAGALEALDRGGEAALAAFLDQHPAQREQVLALITQFRAVGLLQRDARTTIPERLGDFRLLRRLGSGGMGVVFVAEQESLRRTVALKVVRPDLLFFEGTRERFRREIEVIARLEHPAIVPILATGEHDGVPWYAMPLVDGCSADELVRRLAGRDPATLGGADLARAIAGADGAGASASAAEQSAFVGSWWQGCVHLVRQAAVGLAHAHARGIVHRDVKPSNVMLTRDGRSLLVDFGLALVQGDARLTRTGGEPGSPAYMAPEQVRGLGADERSDIYSLAATLFQLLDLQAPFRAQDSEQLRAQILHGRRGELHNRAVPRELRLVLAAAMDLDRDRRYPSAAAFADDLTAVLERRPIAARPLPVHIRATRWAQRHRTAAALLLALLVGAAVMPSVLAWQRGRDLQTLAAETRRAELRRRQALAAVNEFLVQFAGMDLAAMPGGREMSGALLDRARVLLDELAEGDEPTLRYQQAAAERWLIEGLIASGRGHEAQARAEALLRRLEQEPVVIPMMACLRAMVRIEVGELAVAGFAVGDVEPLLAAIERDLELSAADPDLARDVVRQRAHVLSLRGLLARGRGDLAAAERHTRAAMEMLAAAAVDAHGHATAAVQRNRLADLLYRGGRVDEAEPLFADTVRTLTHAVDRVFGRPDHLPVLAYAQWGLARIGVVRQDWTAAEAAYAIAITSADIAAGCYPDNESHRMHLAAMLTEFGQVQGVVARDRTAGRDALARAHRLFAAAGALGDEPRRNRITNLRTYGDLLLGAEDHAALIAAAGALKGVEGDAELLALAAWQTLLAADLAEASGDAPAAVAAADQALAMLQACDRAGWFPPVRLDDGPCRRLQGRPEFAALVARHPPAQATRTPPR